MADLVQNIKASWQTYTTLLLVAGTVTAFASLPARMDAMEKRQDRSEIVDRYIACWLKATSEGRDPRACESHLTPDLLDYLRP